MVEFVEVLRQRANDIEGTERALRSAADLIQRLRAEITDQHNLLDETLDVILTHAAGHTVLIENIRRALDI